MRAGIKTTALRPRVLFPVSHARVKKCSCSRKQGQGQSVGEQVKVGDYEVIDQVSFFLYIILHVGFWDPHRSNTEHCCREYRTENI